MAGDLPAMVPSLRLPLHVHDLSCQTDARVELSNDRNASPALLTSTVLGSTAPDSWTCYAA